MVLVVMDVLTVTQRSATSSFCMEIEIPEVASWVKTVTITIPHYAGNPEMMVCVTERTVNTTTLRGLDIRNRKKKYQCLL